MQVDGFLAPSESLGAYFGSGKMHLPQKAEKGLAECITVITLSLANTISDFLKYIAARP